MKGYRFRSRSGTHVSPPVVRGEHEPSDDGAIALSFEDLVEVRFVEAFLNAGVTWKALRLAHDRACELLKVNHPFATQKFVTDGHTILVRASEPALLDLVKDQLAFSRVIAPFLVGLEFEGEVAIRWWPMGKKRSVVIDASRSFGQPIVSKEGVPTAVLHRAYAAESRSNAAQGGPRKETKPRGSVAGRSIYEPAIATVASWFKVEKRSVRAAVEYETQLAA
jgi:hypothetical protein